MGLIEKLEQYMHEKGISRMQLAKEAGLPYTTVVNFWKEGTENIKLSTLRKLSNYLGCSLDELIGEETHEEADGMVYIPIVGTISCGNGIVAYENLEGYEPIPKDWVRNGEYFILRAKGDSMINARIQEGDLLIIKKQSIFNDGDIVAVIIDGEDAVLKRAYRRDGLLILQSENQNYEPIVRPLDDEGIIIVGILEKVIINMRR